MELSPRFVSLQIRRFSSTCTTWSHRLRQHWLTGTNSVLKTLAVRDHIFSSEVHKVITSMYSTNIRNNAKFPWSFFETCSTFKEFQKNDLSSSSRIPSPCPWLVCSGCALAQWLYLLIGWWAELRPSRSWIIQDEDTSGGSVLEIWTACDDSKLSVTFRILRVLYVTI